MHDTTDGTSERTFTFGPGAVPRVVANTPTGSVDIRGEAREDVYVRVMLDPPEARDRGWAVAIAQHGDTVAAEVKPPHNIVGWLRNGSVRVEVEMRVPHGANATANTAAADVTISRVAGGTRVRTASGEIHGGDLGGGVQITTASGDVHLNGVRGDLRCVTASGDVEVAQAEGEVGVASTSGDVRLSGVVGPLALTTVSGDAEVRASALPRARVKTVSGDVALTTPLHREGEYRFETVSGDVELIVPDGAALTVAYQTVSGDMESAAPARREGGKRSGTLAINGGGVSVAVKSVSGDLSVRTTREALPDFGAVAPMHTPSPAPEPEPRPEAEPSETLRVLQAVERGELTIDEAMSRLAALEEAEAKS